MILLLPFNSFTTYSVTSIADNRTTWPERDKKTDALRLRVDYLHNLQVLVTQSGTLIVEKTVTAKDYLPCINCKDFLRL